MFSTQWGQRYPALAVLLVFPSYCLMTCRHIICSVTKMKFNWKQYNPLWFSLFLLNKLALSVLPRSLQQQGSIGNDLLPESWVAAIVFIATFTLFMRFTVDTIGQITTYLNINCLTIKKKET